MQGQDTSNEWWQWVGSVSVFGGLTPHYFCAHLSEGLHLGEDHVGDVVVYWNVASVWQSFVGIRVCGITTGPGREAVFLVIWVEPLGEAVVGGAVEVRLISGSSIEEFLEEIAVRVQGDAGALCDIRGEVEDGVAVVVFGDLDEVVCSGIGK